MTPLQEALRELQATLIRAEVLAEVVKRHTGGTLPRMTLVHIRDARTFADAQAASQEGT